MEPGAVAVRPMTADDWPAVERIYAAGIAAGHATFESEPPTWSAFDGSRLREHRHVAIAGDEVLGWAACSAVSSRSVYAGAVEHSIYVAPEAQGRGVGGVLLAALVASTEEAGVWTVQSSIFGENEASLRLHLAHGFRVVGTRERIGRASVGPMAGRWRDTVLVERRSERVGR